MEFKNFCIREDYQIREKNDFLDTSGRSDEYQNDVYLLAKKIANENNVNYVSDVGCGSAYKLMKYFLEYNTVGYDLELTVNFLRKKYPKNVWVVSNFNDKPQKADLVICADVIEHVDNPDDLMRFIMKMNPKHVIISTPDRDLLHEILGRSHTGPPINKHHIREWAYDEFYNYISQYFNVIQHEKIFKEYGQVIYCTKKI